MMKTRAEMVLYRVTKWWTRVRKTQAKASARRVGRSPRRPCRARQHARSQGRRIIDRSVCRLFQKTFAALRFKRLNKFLHPLQVERMVGRRIGTRRAAAHSIRVKGQAHLPLRLRRIWICRSLRQLCRTSSLVKSRWQLPLRELRACNPSFDPRFDSSNKMYRLV